MYRERKPPILPVNIVLNHGGLGDALAALPVVRYLHIEHGELHPITLWVPDYLEELAKVCFPQIKVYNFSKRHVMWKSGPTLQTRNLNPMPSLLRKHILHYAVDMLADGVMPKEYQSYLKPSLENISVDIDKFNVKWDKAILITPYYTSGVRKMNKECIDGVSQWCVDNDYVPVYIGKRKTIVHTEDNENAFKHNTIIAISDQFKNMGVNLTNRTSLLETLAIMQKSAAIVGVDNGLIHLAGMTDIPIVAAYTTCKAFLRAPLWEGAPRANMTLIEAPVSCQGCQSNWTLDFKQNFTKCFYRDVACVKSLNSNMFIEGLEKLL